MSLRLCIKHQRLPFDFQFIEITETKRKDIPQNQTPEEFKPKLKKIKDAEITESPLEKLMQLENGMGLKMSHVEINELGII